MTLRWAQEHLDAFDECKDARDTYRENNARLVAAQIPAILERIAAARQRRTREAQTSEVSKRQPTSEV